ncbi:uncharacterized protein MELLADRAFT_105144 [Melampsora larici-populina 98AG31]|uniref:Secreted protein n=1 Tax=Melampsora larici-populina (strain 98AG31 / pathotype 3-4-7) TaxID=747676 RepID=F4RGS2_MELLP|nr:uncharacterized protein MELLADRAFT_105144 [Melampsora larici-populina 98AG31]EGG08187.1 secreted protein [Melampsora larici-populina 98AG31]
MRAFILLGFLLQVLFVLGYPESIGSLKKRDLNGPQSIPSQQLSKRTTSPSNPVVCPGPDGPRIDMNDYYKMITALVQRKVKCVYYANMGMAVFDRDDNPATFTDSDPSIVREWYGAQLSEQCETQRPVRVRSKLPPIRPDDSLNIGTVFYKIYAPSEQVMNCNEEDDAAIRSYLLSQFMT